MFQWLQAKTPDYYTNMYLDGYSPDEIYSALRKKMLERAEDTDEKQLTFPTPKIVFNSEVKIKK